MPIYPIQRFGTIGTTFGTIYQANKKPLLRTVTAFCLEARTEQAGCMRRLRALEDLGHALGIMSSPKTPGKKPS